MLSMKPQGWAIRNAPVAMASLEALLAVEAGQHADRAMNEVVRRFRLQGADRLAVRRWFYGVLRWQGRYDAALQGVQGPWADPVCRNAARLALCAQWDMQADADWFGDLATALIERGQRQGARLLRKLASHMRQLPLRTAASRWTSLAAEYSHPEWMVRRFAAEYPADYLALLSANNQEPPITLRVNPLKTDVAGLRERLAHEGIQTAHCQYSPLAVRVFSEGDVFRTTAFRDGLFELQDEASQLLGWVLDPKPRGLIIDACAGSGGKTLLLAGLLRNRARIVSVDIYEAKLARLRERARRAGVSNVQTLQIEPGGIHPNLAGAADAVMVDAPCTGLGVLRRNPDAKWRIQEKEVAELAARQFGILAMWAQAVKPGGVLVYSTCTLTHAENQDVVHRFLQTHPDFVVEPVSQRLPGMGEAFATADGYFQALPHRQGTDGFFAARMRRLYESS